MGHYKCVTSEAVQNIQPFSTSSFSEVFALQADLLWLSFVQNKKKRRKDFPSTTLLFFDYKYQADF